MMIKGCCWENGRVAMREVSAPCSGGAVWKSCATGTHKPVSLFVTGSAGCLPQWLAQVGWSHDLAWGWARCLLPLKALFISCQFPEPLASPAELSPTMHQPTIPTATWWLNAASTKTENWFSPEKWSGMKSDISRVHVVVRIQTRNQTQHGWIE